MDTEQVPSHYRELIEMLGVSGKSETYIKVFRLIEADHEDTLRLFTRCLTTGSTQAREHTEEFIHALVLDINHTLITKIKTQSDARRRHPYTYSNLLWVWNSINVLNECGITYTEGDNDILIATNIIEAVYPQIDREALKFPATDEYWRGLAIMALTEIRPEVARDDNETLSEYLAWAGTHPDALSVIDLTIDRGTFNVSTLRGIQGQRGTTAKGLTKGLL